MAWNRNNSPKERRRRNKWWRRGHGVYFKGDGTEHTQRIPDPPNARVAWSAELGKMIVVAPAQKGER